MEDRSYLAWPFFDDGHRDYVREVEGIDRGMVVNTCEYL